nr:TniB family NTP-binding protein [uncultured Albidiferax sp.]
MLDDAMRLPPADRESLIEHCDQHFTFTSELLEIAAGLQILFRRALVMRNALFKPERVRVNRIALASNPAQFKMVSALDGAGMLLAGMTGTGKSAIVERVLEVIAPIQVVDYGNSPACEFHYLRQCYYLYIDQPSNGTRGGLLKRLLLALDSALGTNHFTQHKRTTNIDTLLVVACKLLTLHRVALLVIDEHQQSNFADSPWTLEFVLFYHMLMNLGISVVLVGNPLAFDHLLDMSQVMRRFSTGGSHKLVPATENSRWWSRDFVPGARKFNLVEEWNVEDEWRRAFELEHSGGLPAVYMALHKEVMRTALRRGGQRAQVTQADFLTALRSPRFTEMDRIARSVNASDGAESLDFLDIPPTRGTKVLRTPADTEATTEPPALTSNIPMARVTRMLTSFKAAQTKKLNTMKRRIEVVQSLSPEDARMLGVGDELIQSMQDALAAEDGTVVRRRRRPAS